MTKKNKNVQSGKDRKRLFFLSLPVFLILVVLFSAGRFLDFSESPRPSDVIIVLSGGGGRVEEGEVLYSQKFASYLMFSRANERVGASGDMLQTALSLGIPPAAILTENEALSTYQNAELTLHIMQQHGFTSAIVVSSDFHMRRVKFIFDHVYKNSGIKLNYVGANTGYNAKWWWSDHYSRETTVNEYIKMIGNAFGYNGPEAKETLQEIKRWFH